MADETTLNKRPDSNKFISKYLQHYAVREVNSVENLFADSLVEKSVVAGRSSAILPGQSSFGWRHGLIIPAYAEAFHELLGVTRALRTALSRILQIWVVNCPQTADSEYLAVTRQCFQDALASSIRFRVSGNLYLCQYQWGVVLIVDRCGPGLSIPDKQGVGGARKIGGDIAVTLYQMGLLASPWCGFTDADTRLPGDYFDRLEKLPAMLSAVIFPHQHELSGDVLQRQTIACYQRKLDYHVAGLEKAGSPYAFYTIGSTLACCLESYAKVRGVPARAAAEDFYLLNKLAKVGAIKSLTGAPVILSGRRSQRAPFGTGQTINKVLQHNSILPTQFNPLVYELLAVLLASLPEFWQQQKDPESVVKKLCCCLDKVLQTSEPPLARQLAAEWVRSTKFCDAVLSMLAKSTCEDVFYRHFHCWFDGFRTLKFIHWWRDHGLHNVPV